MDKTASTASRKSLVGSADRRPPTADRFRRRSAVSGLPSQLVTDFQKAVLDKLDSPGGEKGHAEQQHAVFPPTDVGCSIGALAVANG